MPSLFRRQPPQPQTSRRSPPSEPPDLDCYFDTVVADAPIAYWRLGEPSGATAVDEMGAYDGTYTNGPTYGAGGALTGDTNTAVTFPDGVAPGTYVVVPGLVVPASAFSLEAWVKGAFSNGDSGVLGRQTGSGALLYVNSVTYVELDISGVQVQYNTAGDPSPVNDGNWHHLVGTWDGANGRMYLDGALVAGPTAVASFTAAGAFIIGNYGNDPPSQGPFDGSIDEPAVYDYALTPAQILAHYNARSVECPPISFDEQLDLLGYVGHYKLGEASGSVIDRSGTANHGTVNNDNGTIVRDVTGGLGNGQDDGAMGVRGFGHVDIPHNAVLNIGDSFTFGFGFKRTSGGGNSAAVWNKGSGADDIYIYFSSTDQLRLAPTASGTSVVSIDNTNPKLTDNAWHFVVVTKSGATAKWYIDGVDATNTGTNVTFADNSDAVFLGSAFDSTDRFNGDLDEFFIADTAYTQQNVTDLYDSWLNGVPDTGGTGYNRTAADAPTTSDAASRVLTLARSTADTRTTSDAASRILTLARSAGDAPTTSDTATRVVGFVRTAADTRTTSDAASRTLALARSTADATSLSDSVVQGGTRSRTAADTRTTSDAATRVIGLTRSAADTRTTTDAATRTLALARTAVDTRTTSDASTRTLALQRSASDTRTTSDTATRSIGLIRTATDAALAYEPTILADGPIAYWRLGEPSGTTLVDETGNGHTGTWEAGTPTFGVTGLVGDSDTAVTLDGSQRASVPDDAAWNLTDFTVEAWIKFTSLTQYQRIIGHQATDYWVLAIDTGALRIGASLDGVLTTLTGVVLNDNVPHHLAIVRDAGTSFTTYVDGEEVDTRGSASGAAYNIAASVLIGAYSDQTQAVIGTIDEIAVYDYALTPVQVASHYAATVPAFLSDSATQTGTRPRSATDAPTTSDAASRTLVLARSAADTRTTSDAAIRVIGLTRSASDAVSTNDSTSRLINDISAAQDSPATSDSATRTGTFNRSATDAPTTSDAATRSIGLFRSASDTRTTSDAATRTIGLTRSATDAPTLSDAATEQGTRARTATDAPTLSDAAVQAGTRPRTAADTRTTSDAASRTLALARSTTDAPTLSDAATKQLVLIRTATDARITSDAATRTTTLSRSATDTRTTSDAATQTGTRPRTAADTRSTTDAATRLLVLQRSAADTRTTSDAATRTLALVRSVADTRTTTDSATRLLALARSASDTRTTSDAATRTVVLFRTAADNPTLSDTAVVEAGNDRFLTDTPQTSDAATRTLVLARSAADTRTTSDAATQTGSRSRTAADTRTTSDAATRTLALARSAIDDRITSDSASRTLTLARAAIDNPTLSDSAARYVTTIRQIHGQADLADSAIRTIGLQRAVADNPTFSDTATVSVHLSRAAIDGVAFSDEAAAALAGIIGTDTISFSDIAEITIVRGGQPISKRRADGGYILVPYGKLPEEEREPRRKPERKPVHYMVAAFDGFGITDAASSSTIQSEDWLFDLDEESLILLT